ncbi:amidohydrolase family protein [Curtobacterium sp. PhB136]|uniref:amidohydrolase n=1 Tax=Curtobacterium sp. PhB136 TaxID=2485181 RepID=UPI00105389CE|nr:amidohydrolase family protein [Curtobacterium sp. PhB136]TCK65705.1 hypothetical protein EDF27_0445 [Curtobacterium sp. PhB136]
MRLDLLITNASIRTLDPARPTATTIGIWQGRIVGLDEDVAGLDAAEIVDLHGATVLPGFIDAHTHLQLVGQSLQAVDIGGITEVDRALEAIAARAAEVPEDGWVTISGYDQRVLGRDLTALELDRAVGPRRAWARHVSSHSSVVSTAVLDRIDDLALRAHPDVAVGLLEEGHQDVVRGQRLPYAIDDVVEAVALAADQARAEGVTMCIEAGAGGWIGSLNPLDLEAFRRLQEQGRLPLRMQIMPSKDALHAVRGGDGFTRGLSLGLRTGMGADMLGIGPLKFVLDGGMMVRTAHLSEPYEGSDDRGALTEDADVLMADMADAVAGGWQLAVHAIGDAALDVALDGFERAFAATPHHRGRHRIEHGGLIRDDQVPRLAALGIAVAGQACFLWDSGDDFAGQVGEHRVPWLYRGRSLLDAGVPLIGSTDRPLPGTPLRAIQTAVERRSSTGRPLAPHEGLTVAEAVATVTTTAAWAAGMEDRLGILAPGFLADLVLLEADPFLVDTSAIADIPVLGTVVDGRFTS